MEPYAPTPPHWSTSNSTPSTDGPNTRSRLSFGLTPISGQVAPLPLPLPPASYPSPAESPNEQWSYYTSECAAEEGNAWLGEEPAQWLWQREGEGEGEEGPAQYAYDRAYDPAPPPPPPPGSFFELDPSLPLPSPAELEQYAYPLYSPFPSHSTTSTTIYSWAASSSSSTVPFETRPTRTSADFEAFAGSADVTGLVSREEWLRLGGFEEGGPRTVEKGEEEEGYLAREEGSTRRSRSDDNLDDRATFAERPSPHYSFPPSSLPPSNLSPFALEQRSNLPSFAEPPSTSSLPFPSSSRTRLPIPPHRPTEPAPPPTPDASFSLTPLPSLPPLLTSLPSTTCTSSSSHSRRHSPTHIPRPRNAFILFRQHAVSTSLIPRDASLGLTSHSNISQVVGAIWRAMGLEEKRHWELLAEEEKRVHRERWPEYAFRPKAKGVRKKVGTGKKALATKARREAEEAASRTCSSLGVNVELPAAEEGKKKRPPKRTRTLSTTTTTSSNPAAAAAAAARESRKMELVAQALLEGEEEGRIKERVEEELAMEEEKEEEGEELPYSDAPALPAPKLSRPSLNRPRRPATYSHTPLASTSASSTFASTLLDELASSTSAPSSNSSFSKPKPKPPFRPSRLAKRRSLPLPVPSPHSNSFPPSSSTRKLPPQQQQQAMPFHLGGADLFGSGGGEDGGTQQAGDLERLFGGRVLRR